MSINWVPWSEVAKGINQGAHIRRQWPKKAQRRYWRIQKPCKVVMGVVNIRVGGQWFSTGELSWNYTGVSFAVDRGTNGKA